MEEIIENKIASSGLIVFDLDDYYHPAPRITLDLKIFLHEDSILKEKLFREYVSNHDWTQYIGKLVNVICSVDTIIPHWAYIIVINKLVDKAIYSFIGDLHEMNQQLYRIELSKIDWEIYTNKKVVIKGCGSGKVPLSAYGELTAHLSPLVDSLMFGEPCSTVPVYKRKRAL